MLDPRFFFVRYIGQNLCYPEYTEINQDYGGYETMHKLLGYRFFFKAAEDDAEAKNRRKNILAGLGLTAFLLFAASIDSIINLLLAL